MNIALCIFVLAVSASTSPNVQAEPNDVNWQELSQMLEEMHMLTKDLFDYTVLEAKQGNPEVGNELEALFKREMPESVTLMKEAVKEVTEKTLTHDKVANYLNRFKVFMQKIGGEVQNYLTRLPQTNSANIGKKIEEIVAKLKDISHSFLTSFQHVSA